MNDLFLPRSETEGFGQTFISEPSPDSARLLRELFSMSLILDEDWQKLPPQTQEQISQAPRVSDLLSTLVQAGLLNEYQADRVAAGKTFGLVLGNYRILGRLGAGGMGVVFKAEHRRLRRLVAIKVVPSYPLQDPRLLARFLSEMRAVASLQHPNIVGAMDAGEIAGTDEDAATLHYFVMEYVPGEDLEELVYTRGPLPPAEACGIAYQVAAALAEAHKQNLVHRDIKPSNIRVTPDGQAKLLDFGLVLQSSHRMTQPGTVLGTLDYLAPEQAQDASSVDIRADLYCLGATLFWCLTGKIPAVADQTMMERLISRSTQPPPSIRTSHPRLSAELDHVVARMMATQPADRYPTPQAVMSALLTFLKSKSQETVITPSALHQMEPSPSPTGDTHSLHRVLVVDDSPTIRQFCVFALQDEGIPCDECANGALALAAVRSKSYDVILTDWMMPEMTGLELCKQLRKNPPAAHLKIILFSAEVNDDVVAEALSAGADDYLNKQFSPVQLVARVKAALQMKDAQDRTHLLNQHIQAVNAHLEQNLKARDSDLLSVRSALVLGLADLVSCRDLGTVSRSVRLQHYSRCLAEEASKMSPYATEINPPFIQMLECCVPLYDIGNVGLPDHILGKAGNLNDEERVLMQTHTIIGAESLQRVALQHGPAVAFLQMAIDIARHHHERYDGKGYPDRLAGADIPLAARIVTIGDVYDALRSRRAYKPALAHGAALSMMHASSGQFDPLLFQAFLNCAAQFERIFKEWQDAPR